MTTTVLRPNRDALDKGLNIYRDAMRPFTLRGLKRVRGMTVEQAIQRALPPNVYALFSTNSRKPGASLRDALDVSHFPHIIRRFWQETFRHEFQDERGVWNRLWIIAEARNQVAHPLRGAKDLDADIAADALFNISYILRAINATEEAAAVQKIREGVTAPPTPAIANASGHSSANAFPQRRRQSSATPSSQRRSLILRQRLHCQRLHRQRRPPILRQPQHLKATACTPT